MRKIFLMVLGFAISSLAYANGYIAPVAQGFSFTGPYLLIGPSFVTPNDRNSFTEPGEGTEKWTGGDFIYGGVLTLGYGYQFANNAYLGLDIFGKLQSGDGGSFASDDDDHLKEMQALFSYGAAAKLGYVFNEHVLPYVMFGVEAGNFRVKATFDDVITNKFNQTAVAYVPGAGIMTHVDNFLFGLQFNYAAFSTIKHTEQGEAVKITPRRSSFTINVGYLFPTNW